MKTRTYRGNEVNTLMTQIKEEIGEEAIILSMQETKGMIEIQVGWHQEEMIRLMNPLNLVETAEKTQKLRGVEKKMTRSKVASLHQQLVTIMTQQGIAADLAEDIAFAAEPAFGIPMSADKYISKGLEHLCAFDSMIPGQSRVVALVGATGVGKTTTIAKLAARLHMTFHLSIALIAADSYRVGAGYHLETYASLLNLPCKKLNASSATLAQDLKNAVESFQNFDLILIDTAGCGPREKGRIEQLQDTLSLIPQAERMLVLPAPSNDFDLHAAASSFETVNYSRIILSKVDESGFIGPVVNTVVGLQQPLAFITTGQRVPEDIEPASARRLAWMLTREMH